MQLQQFHTKLTTKKFITDSAYRFRLWLTRSKSAVKKTQELEVYHLVDGAYQLIQANERGHYPISRLGVELGLWTGNYQNQHQCWLRWWTQQGDLMLTGAERADNLEKSIKDSIPKLLAMGLSIEQVAEALSLSAEVVREFNS